MSFVKIDKDEFLFIKFCQEIPADLQCLKNALEIESKSDKERDIVLVFANTSAIYSMEIGVIVQLLKTLRGTNRYLRFVASNYVREMLITMNIHRIPNFVMYGCLEDIMQEFFPNVDISTLEC